MSNDRLVRKPRAGVGALSSPLELGATGTAPLRPVAGWRKKAFHWRARATSTAQSASTCYSSSLRTPCTTPTGSIRAEQA